jgi:hypothetical protein
MATKCLTCFGVYSTLGADGMLYFHACPPVFDDVKQRYVPRPDARDENVDPVKAAARAELVAKHDPRAKDLDVSKAAGKGVTTVADVEPA